MRRAFAVLTVVIAAGARGDSLTPAKPPVKVCDPTTSYCATVDSSGAIKVSGGGGGTVDQGLGGTSAWKVDGSAVTQPISGTVSATQSGAWTVGQSGAPWGFRLRNPADSVYLGDSSNPLVVSVNGTPSVTVSSGTVSASQSGSPWGFRLRNPADSAYLGDSSNPLVVSVNGSVAVTGTFWQSTQPISGTVTANQGTAGVSAWKVDGSGVTQPVSGTVSAAQSGSWTVTANAGSGTFNTMMPLATTTLLNAVTAAGASSAYTNTNGCTSFTMQYKTTGSPSTISIRLEGSQDNSTWVQISPTGTSTGGGQASAAGAWSYVRANLVTLSGGSSPTVTAYLGCGMSGAGQQDGSGRLYVVSPGNAGSSAGGVFSVQGNDANNGTVTENPLLLGGYSWTDGTNPTATTAGNVTKLLTTTDGRLVVTEDHPTRFHGQSGATTATSTTQLLAAPGASLSYYITSISVSASVASTTTASQQLILQYGTGSNCGTGNTNIYVCFNPGPGGCSTTYPTPVKIPANNAICFLDAATGSKAFDVAGYIAP